MVALVVPLYFLGNPSTRFPDGSIVENDGGRRLRANPDEPYVYWITGLQTYNTIGDRQFKGVCRKEFTDNCPRECGIPCAFSRFWDLRI